VVANAVAEVDLLHEMYLMVIVGKLCDCESGHSSPTSEDRLSIIDSAVRRGRFTASSIACALQRCES
jgi:hypothetical protein